jgi:hypothetical protein
VCWQNCPGNMTDIGVSCQKGSYDRGVGTPLTCPPNTARDSTDPAGLCYPPCPSDHPKGVGPLCYR